MLDALGWFFGNLFAAFVNFFSAIANPGAWLDWSNSESLMRFIYYGGSVELFFVVLLVFLIVFAVGVYSSAFLWRVVFGLELFANTTGRLFAWAGLLMVLQQTLIVFLQRIFAASELSFGAGVAIAQDVSWWSDELKLYNAAIVCMCCAYTFVQGGQVRVDLFYAGMSHRRKRIVDMFGSIFFMVPTALVIWMYAWYFLWRHLVTPKVSASDQIDRMIMKARALRWNVETIGFSANGFSGYFIFKVLMVVFAGMVLIQGIAFFYRSYLEYREGEASAGKNLDKDYLGDPDAELVAEIH